MCTPRSYFCDGNTIAVCSRAGTDAFDFQTCTGSTTNPQTCVSTGCENSGGEGACCKSTKPIIMWDITSPTPATQGSYTGIESSPSGNGPDPCLQGTTFSMSYYDTTSMCPQSSTSFSLSYPRATLSPGSTITLTAANQQGGYVSYNVQTASGQTYCSQWSGTIKLDSDAPNWMVEVDLVCTQSPGTGVFSGTFAGTFSGST